MKWTGVIVSGLLAALGLLPDLFIQHHAQVGGAATFGFYAWYGFSAAVGLIAAARVLSIFIRRKDIYYDRD